LGDSHPGVFASLDPRLISVTPPGVDDRDFVASGQDAWFPSSLRGTPHLNPGLWKTTSSR